MALTPMLSRVLCAASALANVSATELATKAGLSASRVSQLRSGARGDVSEIERLLRIVGVSWEALIQHLGDAGDWSTRTVEELLCALVLSFDQEVPTVGSAPPRIACDRLAITLVPTSRGEELIDEFFASAKRLPTDGHYGRAGRYRGVWIGHKLRWRKRKGARIDFNPSNIGSAGIRIAREIVAASRDVHFTRVDVAVDLPTSLLAVQPIGTTQRKVTTVSTGSRIETIYVGSRDAELAFAIYDRKAKLQRQDRDPARVIRPVDEDDTRFEARMKKRRHLPAELRALH